MNTYPQEFYDPLYIALGGNMGLLQSFVDDVLATKYNTLQIDGFSFNEDLLPDFTYAQVEKELKMNVMASYVDIDSPAIPIAHKGDTLATGSIPRMKSVEYYNEDKLRKLKMRANRRDVTAAQLQASAGAGMIEVFDTLVGGHVNSLTYQRNQIVSTGKLTLTDKNNPRGIQNVTFAAHVPSANSTTLSGTKRWWTSVSGGVYSNEGSACDPIADLQAMVKAARKKSVSKLHFEVQDSYLDQVLAHSKVVSALKDKLILMTGAGGFTDASVGLLSRAQKITALGEIVGAPIISRDNMVMTQYFDKTTKKIVEDSFDSFEDNVFVLIPDGNIGEILTVEPILVEGGEYAYYFGGKLVFTIGKDYVKKCMSYNSEMTSLLVPNKPKYFWYLHPYGAN